MISRQIVRDVAVLQRPRVGRLEAVDDLGLALGAEHGRAFGALEVPDLVGQRRAAVEGVQQLAIDGIDFGAQLGQVFFHGVSSLPGGIFLTFGAPGHRSRRCAAAR